METQTIAWLEAGLIMKFLLVTAMAAMATMPLGARADETAPSRTGAGYYLGTQIHGPDNKDRLTNPFMHTLPLKDVVEEAWTGTDAQFPPSRVISIVSSVVVRQNDAGGPHYQEAPGYAFVSGEASSPRDRLMTARPGPSRPSIPCMATCIIAC